MSAESPSVRIRLVARNESGTFLAAMCKKLRICADPTSAEALAAYYVVEFAIERGYSLVWFEGDSQVVINSIGGDGGHSSAIGHIVNDIEQLAVRLFSCKWSHVRRLSNGVAHCLAKHVIVVSNSETWMEEVPLFCYLPFHNDLCS